MTQLMRFSRLMAASSLLTLLVACGSSGLEITAQFSNTQDIDKGAIVYFDNEPIGQVIDTKVQGNGAAIVIELEESAAELVGSNAAVVVNRLKQGAPLEIYNPNSAASEFVQDGQALKGLDSMFQLGAWMVGDAIQLGSSSLGDYVTAFQEYLQSDKFEQDKSSVQAQVDTATNQAQQAIESIGTELATAMQELSASEGDAAQAVEQLGEELSPVVQEIAKSGALLMAQLEAFTQGLEQTDQTEQQAGQTFLESLTVMLEQLNQSIEQGIEESVDEGFEEGIEEDAPAEDSQPNQ